MKSLLNLTFSVFALYLSFFFSLCASASPIAEPRYHEKIVGGGVFNLKRFPAVGKVYAYVKEAPDYKIIRCSATLIAPNWVVTAAHCHKGTNYDRQTVVFGRADLRDDKVGEEVPVVKVILHPSYDKGAPYNADIAVLKLAYSPKKTTPLTEWATKTDFDKLKKGKKPIIAVGWGNTVADQYSQSPILKGVGIRLWTTQSCRFYSSTLDWLDRLSSDTFCAGSSEFAGQGICSGDSGGPAFRQRGVDGSSKTMLVGISSRAGQVCAEVGRPSIFVEAWRYKSWVDSTIKRNSK
jgi:secreted trypsin-like serine protease